MLFIDNVVLVEQLQKCHVLTLKNLNVLPYVMASFYHPRVIIFILLTEWHKCCRVVQKELEMWANAQRDDRPAEYRWRPLLNAAVWLTPTTRVPCSNVAKTRNPLKLPEVLWGAPN